MTAKQMIGQLRNLHPDTLLTIKIEDNHDFTPVGGIRDASATEMFAETTGEPTPSGDCRYLRYAHVQGTRCCRKSAGTLGIRTDSVLARLTRDSQNGLGMATVVP